MNKQNGFSLIELLIAVVIIGIIAAIAIPNLLASRRATNEASAISTMRIYHSGQMTYQATSGAGSYAGLFTDGDNAFGILADLNIMDTTFAVTNPEDPSIKSGYQFLGAAFPPINGQPANFVGMGQPTETIGVTQTGTRKFVILTEGVIYWDDNDGTHALILGLSLGGITISGGVPLNN